MAEQLKSLRDCNIAFTGRLTEPRWVAVQWARRAGARVQGDVSHRTTVVVQGAPTATYKWVEFGTKLERAARYQRAGQLIYVINEDEFDQLLQGRALSREASRVASYPQRPTELGVPYRPEPRRRMTRHTLDLDALDRATNEHRRLVHRLANEVRARGFEPLSWTWHDCRFDLAWRSPRRVNVVEVKTLGVGNELQQLRLGLGQILDYAHTLRDRRTRGVRPVLVVPRVPDAVRFQDVCRDAGVALAWPDRFSSAFG